MCESVVPHTQGVPGSHRGLPGGLGGAPSGRSSVPTAMDGADDISRCGTHSGPLGVERVPRSTGPECSLRCLSVGSNGYMCTHRQKNQPCADLWSEKLEGRVMVRAHLHTTQATSEVCRPPATPHSLTLTSPAWRSHHSLTLHGRWSACA